MQPYFVNLSLINILNLESTGIKAIVFDPEVVMMIPVELHVRRSVDHTG